VATVVDGDFEWDDSKARDNLAKHGVSFEEAISVFADGSVLILSNGSGGERLVAIGMSARTRVLCVVHAARGERDRIISARLATAAEEALYVQGG
jgi:uncharacterized DUF497 family protein